jgi:translocation and assembly module TamB
VIRRAALWAGSAVAAVLVLLCIIVAWLVATESGARWLLGQASPRLPGALSINAVHGTLIDGLRFRSLSWRDGAVTVLVAELDTEFELLPLLHREVQINELDLRDVDVSVRETPASDSDAGPFSVDLPLTLRIETSSITNAHVTAADKQLIIEKILLGGELSGSSLQIDRFDLQSELGDISLSGDSALNGAYATNANAAWELRLQGQPHMSGILKLRGDTSRYEVAHNLDAPYEVETSGTLALIDGQPIIDLANTWQQIVIQRGDEPAVVAEAGILRLTGSFSELDFDGSTTIVSGDVPSLVFETHGKLVHDRIRFESLSLANDWGHLSADGEVLLAPELNWNFDINLSDVDPSVVDGRLEGKLQVEGRTDGQIDDSKPQLNLEIASIVGDLNGYPITGNGKLSYASEQLRFNDSVIRVGDNRVDFEGSYGQQLQLDARIRFSDLSQLGIGAAGILNGDLDLVSGAQQFQASGEISGASLAWSEYLVDAVNVEFDLPATGNGTVALQVSSAEQGSVAAEIGGQFVDQQWSGTIEKLAVRREPIGEWTLKDAATFSLSQTRFNLGESCLGTTAMEGFICTAIDYEFSGPLQFETSVNALPLAAIPRNLPEGATVLGELRAEASGDLTNGLLNSSLSLEVDGLGLIAAFEGEEVAANFSKAEVNAAVVDNKLNGEFEFRLDNGVDYAAGSVEIADLFDQRSRLTGQGNLEFNNLTSLSFFVPDLANPVGRIFGRIDASGSLMTPEIVGEIGLNGGSVDIRRAGVSVADVELSLRQSKTGELALQGSAKSGDGYLNLNGATSIGAATGMPTEIRLEGENFSIVRLPDLQVSASPAITVLFDERATRVSGELGIPAANITVKTVPETTEKPSPDAVVHRDDELTKPPQRLLFIDVTTNLGEQVSFSGFGLTTGLDGAVRITGDSNSPYRGFGRVVLREGRYRAYGQNLEIESGELVFNGPLANPALNVRATRTASDETVAGIHLTGTPTALKSEVYSEPALGDAEALSYLLTGRPLNNASSEDGDMLNQAAFALGLTTAGNVASRVRNQLGLETLGIQGGAENRQLVAGKRFGNRLFIEYAYGVVDSLGTLLLRYQLSRRLMVESRSGSVRNLDIVYSVKKQ